MTARVYTMASAKGGSGKTILTIAFCEFLSCMGKKVLMVDSDAATNGLTLFFLREARLQAELAMAEGRVARGSYDCGDSKESPDLITLPSGVDFVPATFTFSDTERVTIGSFENSIHKIIDEARDDYDFIFVDAQAGSDVFAQVVMGRRLSDEVIIVSEYDPISAAGVERLKGLLPKDLTYERTWVLLNKMLPEFVKSFSEFLEVAKYLSPIPWNADVVKSYAGRISPLDLVHGNEFTLAIKQTLSALMGREMDEDFNEWSEGRAEGIRQPIREQYSIVEKKLDNLIAARLSIDDAIAKRRVIVTSISFFGYTIVLAASIIMFFHLAGIASIDAMGLSPVLASFIIFAGFTVFASGQLLRFRYRERRLRRALDLNRIDRQEKLLTEQLRELQSLKDASLDTLVKSKAMK